MLIVSNTTPLINFASIDRLDILIALFGELTIPHQVVTELGEKLKRFPKVAQVSTSSSIVSVPIQNSLLLQTLQRDLDLGEAAAIILALEHNADLILMDEMAGRSMAKFYGLPVIGSIGCLIEAKRRQIIPTIKPLLDTMQTDARFWISNNLYKVVLRDADET